MSSVSTNKRPSDRKGHTETSPLSNKALGRAMGRKRKCPLQPKQIEEEDDFEIIAIDDSSSSSSSCPSTVCLTSDSGIHSVQSSSSVSGSKRIALGPVSSDRVVLKGSRIKGNHVSQSQAISLNSAVNSFRGNKVRMTEGSSPMVFSGDGTRNSPLPHFSWADAREVWNLMVKKDESYSRNPLMISRHPSLQSRMRSILIDWLSEVCEVYRLHRETFYLSVDFIDRYLSNEADILKQQLQLIGITCLFIASKIEEIYPPKINEFAFVTDGACSETDILCKELVILKALRWDLTPMTVNGWLCVYMQLFSSLDKENNVDNTNHVVKTLSEGEEVKKETSSPDSKLSSKCRQEDFMVPGYPSQFFAQVAHLLDLSILDIGSLLFPYSVMAAAALYHFTNENIVFQCTGLKLPQIRECVVWMTPFALAIRDEGFENPKLFKSSDVSESMHNIQSHTADLDLLERAHVKQQMQQESSVNNSPSSVSGSILTPPRSTS